jgi:hypothetical protein
VNQQDLPALSDLVRWPPNARHSFTIVLHASLR